MASTEVTQNARARTTEASSPGPRRILEPLGSPPPAGRAACASSGPGLRRSSAAMDSIRESSAMPVDDPRAVQVIRGQLAANAITRENADPEASHLARHVTEHDVIVIELDAEHRVR